MSNYWILFYDYVDDYLERRTPLRPDHIAGAMAAVEAGHLQLVGAYADPADGAAFVFRCEQVSTIEDFVAADPYVREGLVPSWRIRSWNVVMGTAFEPPSAAASDVRDQDDPT